MKGVFLALVLSDYLTPRGDRHGDWRFCLRSQRISLALSSEFNSCALYTPGDSWEADLVRMQKSVGSL